ncbi:MAG: SulP family inorganic anion transporter [Alphaproteobacteria bacterium]
MKDDWWAAVTGALVVLPQGVAFASIAGMPPQYGLYAGMIPAIIAALFGSSRHLVSGPTTAASIVLLSALSILAAPLSDRYVELALTLTIMVGLIELTLGLFRLGALVNFISHSVIIGFTAGAGILIGVNQIKHFTGVNVPRGESVYGTFKYIFTHADAIIWPVVAAGMITLLMGLATQNIRRLPVPIFKDGVRWTWVNIPRIPYMIVAILAGTIFALIYNSYAPGVIPTASAIPASLPPLSAPSFQLEDWVALAPTAFAVTLFALTEAVSISRAIAVKSGQHIDASQEFIGQGLSNIAGSFFSGYVATGSFNRSGVNYTSGAKTPIAAIIAGVLLMAIVLLVAPFIAYLPNAAMAGVLFLVAWGLIDKHHISQIFRSSYRESGIMLATFIATLTLHLEHAIFIGVTLSLVIYLYQTSHPRIHRRVPDPSKHNRKFTDANENLPECPQVRIIRVDGSLFFGAVNAFDEALLNIRQEDPKCRHLVIVMQSVNFIDIAGAESLTSMARQWHAAGGCFFLINPKDQVVKFLERGGYISTIGKDNTRSCPKTH